MEECSVCCKKYKSHVTCKMCTFSACRGCFKRYIIECTVNPKCMKCDKVWTRKDLVTNFGKHFVMQGYRRKRESVLFELEKTLLPSTQPYAVICKKIKQIEKEIVENQKKISTIRMEIPYFTEDDDEDFLRFVHERRRVRMAIHEAEEDILMLNSIRAMLIRQVSSRHVAQNAKRQKLVVKCPNTSCRGFVDTMNMKCDLCDTEMCKECHEIVAENHECKQENIDTVKLLSKDTKNCPSCKAMIHKIEGCDQMFCTQCNTPFSWRTGEIIYGRVHNPHYFEYLRRNGPVRREIEDIPCGGLPTWHQVNTRCKNLDNILRCALHVEDVEFARYRVDEVGDNRDLRISFLNGDINETVFKTELYRREKSREKKREIHMVLATFVTVCSDIFRNILGGGPENITEFNTIRGFTNETMKEISSVYGCVVPLINQNWQIVNGKV